MTEFDELARALDEHAKVLAQLEEALQEVRIVVFGSFDNEHCKN